MTASSVKPCASVISERTVEEDTLERLGNLGWTIAHGPDISPGGARAERNAYEEVILENRLRDALAALNPGLPETALEDAFRKLTRPEGSTLETCNKAFHHMIVSGVDVEYWNDSGAIQGARARVIDFAQPDGNDWLAANQFTVVENKCRRRPDILLFLNGLPLGLIELKNPMDEQATIRSAWQQLQTYRAELPALFACNEILVVSDGLEARIGTLTAGLEWFRPWRAISDETVADSSLPQLQVMLEGVCEPSRFLALIQHFILFEDDGSEAPAKKMAGYHQFHAVQTAVAETLRATRIRGTPRRESASVPTRHKPGGKPGDRRIGVIWHTQGSGKSLTMAFFAGRIVREPAMENPTVVVLTDRNDLDDQLFGTFARCQSLLGRPPEQAMSRTDLRSKLAVKAGGVVFTTIQKFLPEEKGDRHPLLSDRRNIVIIADEAHRSQYDFLDGFARHMRDALPEASFVGFTGTPIELQDANTRAVFGDYISVYDIQQAVEDQATVPIYYENRHADLALEEAERPGIDQEFEEVTETEERERKEKLKTRWSQLEAVVGADKRIAYIARDIVDHFECREETIHGKAMIVCMSRRICISMHDALIRLRPGWHDRDDSRGQIKVVMTGSASDPADWQPHIRSKPRRESLARRFRAPDDPLQIVLVRDMWLTGFDAPSLHTMYVDKPMRGHGLMQAIARVNRVFRDKPGGRIVDYLGLSRELGQAFTTYTQSGGKGKASLDLAEAVAVMQEKHEVCCDMFHGFDRSGWTGGTSADRLALLPSAQDHVLGIEDGRKRYLQAAHELSKAFALVVPHEDALRIRDDVEFFQYVRLALSKRVDAEARPLDDFDSALRQIVSNAIAPGGIIDIFSAAGLRKPDISILSEEFLSEIRNMPQRNLAVELLQKLLKSEIRKRKAKNIVQSRSFAELLENTLLRYRNRSIGTAQVVEELIHLARDVRDANAKGKELGLTEDEHAFYDALCTNDSAVEVLGDETLCEIARELAEEVRKNTTIDWKLRENVRARLRLLVKDILHIHGYPPDKQEKATQTVIEQAEELSEHWTE